MHSLRTAKGRAISTVQALSLSDRVVQRAHDLDAGLEPLDVPGVDGRAAVAVGLDEQEVPDRVQGVHLQLVIVVGVAVGVDEDLEVVVLEDDGIPGRQGGPDVGLLEVGADVEDRRRPRASGPGSGSGGRASTRPRCRRRPRSSRPPPRPSRRAGRRSSTGPAALRQTYSNGANGGLRLGDADGRDGRGRRDDEEEPGELDQPAAHARCLHGGPVTPGA